MCNTVFGESDVASRKFLPAIWRFLLVLPERDIEKTQVRSGRWRAKLRAEEMVSSESS
jgi:hypothetical protein